MPEWGDQRDRTVLVCENPPVLEAVEACWDPELAPVMRTHGRCVHEEPVLGELLAAVEKG